MCLVCFIIGLLLLFGGFIGWYKEGIIDDWVETLIFIAAVILVITIPISCFYIAEAVDGRYVDGKVAMYQEENEAIEQDVSEIARQYMEHENQTFDMSRISSSTTLVQMYPELQSSEIVQKQIDIYYENNKKIKSLKNTEYSAKKAKFILYFGGGK